MWRNTLPRLEVLSAEQVELVDEHAMTILEEVGIDFLHPRVLELLSDAGMSVEGARVRFDPAWVTAQATRAPASFRLRARNPARTVTIGGDYVVNAPAHGRAFVMDAGRGRRSARIEDVTNFDRLAQAAPQIHCAGGTALEPRDLPLATRHLDVVYSHARWTDMPFLGSSTSAETARDSIAMATIALGHRARIEETPAILAVACAGAALRYDEGVLGALLEYAAANQPVVVTPFPAAGAIAQQCAEVLAAIALVQLVRPGAPCIYGSSPTGMDADSFAAHESALGLVAGAQMARYYRVPFAGGGALTSARAPDARAGYESAMCMWPTVQGGVHLVLHAAGSLEGGLLASYEKFAMDVEMLRLLERMMDRGAAAAPERADRAAPEDWRALLASYDDPGIDRGVDEELRRHVAVRQQEIGRGGG